MQSAFHNLPLVNGQMERGRDAHDRASRVRVGDDAAHTGMTMELATAFGPEAGIRTWTRAVALDRGAGTISLRETFALARPAPVTLVFMTPRRPGPAQDGVLALPVAGGRTVSLRFDARMLRADVERIDLTDPGLRREWGEALYRIRLASTQSLAAGDLAVALAA
jgi:hypothetical protein